MWERQAQLLRLRRYEVVTPDLTGFGTEPVPSEPFSDVERVAAMLPATLVGNSFGGKVALATALSHPDQVPRLVLIAPAIDGHEWSDEMREYWRQEAELIDEGALDAAVELTLEFFAQPEVHETLRPMQRRAYELQVESSVEERWPEEKPFHRLSMPTLLIVGENDRPDFHAIARRITRDAPSARMEVVSGAKHVPSLESPEEFERLLLDFLEHGV
jgi:pimeloyl-ACP methyl ester carboxylesterase